VVTHDYVRLGHLCWIIFEEDSDLGEINMPVKVWREVVKIHRKFLWGGLLNRRKVCWVSWASVCKPKKEGGLGIKDLRLMNSILLTKWR
jgi:hypothetical protein